MEPGGLGLTIAEAMASRLPGGIAGTADWPGIGKVAGLFGLPNAAPLRAICKCG